MIQHWLSGDDGSVIDFPGRIELIYTRRKLYKLCGHRYVSYSVAIIYVNVSVDFSLLNNGECYSLPQLPISDKMIQFLIKVDCCFLPLSITNPFPKIPLMNPQMIAISKVL